jgi:opacity protein-like surface antigen
MNSQTKRLLLATFLSLNLKVASSAAVEAGDKVLSLNLGVVTPLTHLQSPFVGGDDKVLGRPGPSVEAQYLYQITPLLAFGLDLGGDFTRNKVSRFLPGTDTKTHTTSLKALPILRINLAYQGRFVPFLIAGAGLHSTQLRMKATPIANAYWADTTTRESRDLIDDRNTGFAWTAGLGSDFYINDKCFWGLEARYQRFANATYNANERIQASGLAGVSGPIASVTGHIRIGYKFGRR